MRGSVAPHDYESQEGHKATKNVGAVVQPLRLEHSLSKGPCSENSVALPRAVSWSLWPITGHDLDTVAHPVIPACGEQKPEQELRRCLGYLRPCPKNL